MTNLSEVVFSYVANITILFLSYDAVCWSFSLIRHSIWMANNSDKLEKKYDTDTIRLLGLAAVLSGIHILLINLSWLYFKVNYGYSVILFVVIAGVDLMLIHLYALLAKFSGLNKKWWPCLSVIISSSVLSPCRTAIRLMRRNDIN